MIYKYPHFIIYWYETIHKGQYYKKMLVNIQPATFKTSQIFLCRVSDGGVKNDSLKLSAETGDVIVIEAKFSVVKYFIYLHRLPAYYLLNIIVPTMVLAFLSAFTFYVPVDSGEKLSLCITILLSFSVFLLNLSDNTPNISENLPFLGKICAVGVYRTLLMWWRFGRMLFYRYQCNNMFVFL